MSGMSFIWLDLICSKGQSQWKMAVEAVSVNVDHAIIVYTILTRDDCLPLFSGRHNPSKEVHRSRRVLVEYWP